MKTAEQDSKSENKWIDVLQAPIKATEARVMDGAEYLGGIITRKPGLSLLGAFVMGIFVARIVKSID